MKIKVFGFAPKSEELPGEVAPSVAFEAISLHNGAPWGKAGLIRMSATAVDIEVDGAVERWWAGLVVKARDAKTYTRLTNKDGKMVITTADLEGDQMVELCYFLANDRTGKGLLATYHGAPSFPLFSVVCRKFFAIRCAEARIAAIDGLSPKDTKAILPDYRGKLVLTLLEKPETTMAKLKALRSISSIEVSYGAVVTNDGGLFQKAKVGAVKEVQKFKFPRSFVMDDDMIAEFIADSENEEVKEATVSGRNRQGEAKRVSSDPLKDPEIFEERDYDTEIRGIELDLDDWPSHILGSGITKWLLDLARSPVNRPLLTIGV